MPSTNLKSPVSFTGPLPPLILETGYIYVPSIDETLFAFSAKTGTVTNIEAVIATVTIQANIERTVLFFTFIKLHIPLKNLYYFIFYIYN